VSPRSDLEGRVLLRVATARDARMTRDVLARAGVDAWACADMAELIRELARGAGALMVAEEALVKADQAALAAALAAQPPWSDVPVLVLARQGADSDALAAVMSQLPNATVIERPARVTSLVSAARSTLRARQRQYELRARLEELHRADRRKTEFLATLAHELRNPLAPIRTTLALLAGRPLDPAALGRHHDLMRRQVEHMVRLVDDLMDVSRVTRGRVDLQFVPVRLGVVLGDAVELSRPLIDAAGHAVDVDVADEPLQVRGDAVRLTQVFANLLNNAAKYTPPGGRVGVSARRDGAHAVIEVSDTGIGLVPDMLTAIFEMFVQVSGSSRAAQGGLGIGLTLVKTIVELHGGSVTATSAGLQQGATFTVRLPLEAAAANPRSPAQGAADWADGSVDRTVLVVDDNRDAADTLAELLRAMGAEVAAAYSGAEALRLVADRRFDLALLDIGMPVMDGCDLARHVRTLPGGRAMTLIALTGWGQDGDRQRMASAGFDRHLLKPVGAEDLAALLRAKGP